VRQARRGFARQCLDWSQQCPHLADVFGAAVLDRLLAIR
jgi:hypothetical protein